MRSNFVLISSFFASAVLAAPFADTLPDSHWAGSIFTLQGGGTIQCVSSIVDAPRVVGRQVGSSGFALVGIDGSADCPGGTLQLGVKFTVTTEGTSYKAGYRYGMESMRSFDDVHIAAENAIKLTVDAPVGTTLAIVKVENLSNHQSGTQEIHLSESLCGKTAEWVVEEDLKSPLVNFGALTFKNAQASGDDFGFQNRTKVDIVENGSPLTSVSVVDESVTVTWVRL